MSNEPKLPSKDPIRIEHETLKAVIGNKQWDIAPDGHTKTNKDKLVVITKEYEDVFNEITSGNLGLGTESVRIKAHEKATVEILKIACPKLDYEKEANDPEVGSGALTQLSNLLFDFLAVYGGKVGYQHLQMQSRFQRN